MKKQLLKRPSLQNLIQAGRVIINEFDPKKFTYLNLKGEWEENPETLIDRISNESLYQTWKMGEEKQSLFIPNIFSLFASDKAWLITKKIKLARLEKPKIGPESLKEDEIDEEIIQSYSLGGRSEKVYPFLIILEVLAWILHYEAIRLNAESFVHDWDTAAKVQKQESIKELRTLNHFLNCLSNAKENEGFISDILNELNKRSPEIIEPIPKMISEEERLIKTLNQLLEKAEDPKRSEEIFSLIIEKIQPPMGIATLASPALLRPCLSLLMDEKIDISSGIQYNASVILSILQDSRSTETLLKAMSLFPSYYSKIRENLIYTLGNLKEKKAVKAIAQVLEEHDEIEPSQGHREGKIHHKLKQKEEAFWALGKIGLESIQRLSSLVKYEEYPSAKLKTYLAWTLGEIGKAQKEKFGGVSADIAITLLKLLKTKNKQIFEETVSALRKIDMPEFTHSLYLYNIGAVSILGLKPAQRGLYELSETLHYLINFKKRAIIAVNGDSGTGKTYFCESIINGFADLKPDEILYLMRDRKKDHKIFNRILGLKWLKKYIEPVYYQDYPLSEEEDDPDEFFRQFLEKNSNKKLIILDGCRDQNYFQRVIDLFYFKGELDVEVNFRATLSTRRLNLEEREIALESVETHLSFVEEPSLEDTHFYQEGIVLLYDLDNSISSRLNSQETQELFEKKKIDSWGDLIRIGDFNQESKPLKIEPETLSLRQENFSLRSEDWPKSSAKPFSPEERKFRAKLNENLAEQPNLLQTIEMDDLKAKQIRFYAQDQIAGIGEEGSVFVLTFLDNRIFYTFVERNTDITLLGRDIFLINHKGELTNVSFERNEIVKIGKTNSPALAITSFPRNRIITGHKDGSIRIWDFLNKNIFTLEGHHQPVLSLAVDYSGRIYSGSLDKTLRHWDMEKGLVNIVENLEGKPHHIKLYPQGKILAIIEGDYYADHIKRDLKSKISIINFKDGISHVIPSPFKKTISGVNVYFDGRIIVGLSASKRKSKQGNGNLAIIIPGKNYWEYKILGGHSMETKDCLATGPRIMTCGMEAPDQHTIRFWGIEYYVRTELSKLSLQPS
jgi:WD40 repeat protein/HEAT repeat protein